MICNTSPLIFLYKIGKLNFLKELFRNVIIPNSVKEEIFIDNKPGYEIINKAIKDNLIIIKDPSKELSLNLGKGENAAISLAAELKDSLIIDDAVAITIANSLGINILRTTTIIFLALNKKLIAEKEANELIDKLIEEGYYISPRYYKEIIDKLK